MHKDEFEKNWEEFKGHAHKKWDKWTHGDASKINGKYEAFVKWLEEKYGYTKAEAEHEIHSWYMEKRLKGHSSSNCSCCGEEGHTKKTGFWKSSEKKNCDTSSKNKKRKAG